MRRTAAPNRCAEPLLAAGLGGKIPVFQALAAGVALFSPLPGLNCSIIGISPWQRAPVRATAAAPGRTSPMPSA